MALIDTLSVSFSQQRNLWFLVSLPLLVLLHYIILRYSRGRVLQFANFVAMARVTTPRLLPTNVLQLAVRLFTLAFLILAVSGMAINYVAPGVDSDYVLAIDVSSSMSATDLQPTRLEAAKEAAQEFVTFVPGNTEMGLVSFSGTTFIEQRLTNDKRSMSSAIERLDISGVGGTDIGEAIISSANLMVATDRPKTVVLLTDGRSNVGVGLDQAVIYAQNQAVQIFTIGVGTAAGGSPTGINVTLTLDEDNLRELAEQTDGNYLYASTKEEIIQGYRNIVLLSQKKITINLIPYLMILALLFVFGDWVLINTLYKRIP